MKELETKPERKGRPFLIDRDPPVGILLPRDLVGDREALRNMLRDTGNAKTQRLDQIDLEETSG